MNYHDRKALRHRLGWWAAGVVIGLGIASFPYKTTTYIIGNTMANVDVVHQTMYINVLGVLITKSHAQYAKITCVDVAIEPATLFQTCHQTED